MNLELVRKYADHQSTNVSCGACSLRHAILCLGEKVSEKKIAKLAGTTWDGVEAPGLITAAEALGYQMTRTWCDTTAEVYEEIRRELHEGSPVILAVDAQDHWIVAIHATSRHVTICDSAYWEQRPTPVVQRLTWRKLLSRACIWVPDKIKFNLYPVTEA